ncbi:hypothetical protein [uncultured Enterovirga sp.]|uniref:hypothetical protein n=1 Tax=uncultured Enterovirga sp. TaxID=2026352 RepID=UPI0035CBA64E
MGALVIQGVPPELLKREALEAHVERLIALLDMLDGDVDLEPDNDDEPSLGWPEGVAAKTWTSLDDREQDAGDECEPDADSEPSLGSPEAIPRIRPEPPVPEYRRPLPRGEPVHDRGSSQVGWAAGGMRDFEDDGDDREPDADREDWRQPVSLNDPAHHLSIGAQQLCATSSG